MAVTVTTGKTHTRYCRFLLGGTDLSGDARSMQSVGVSYDGDADECQGWNASLKQYLMGPGVASMGPFEAVFSNEPAAVGPVEPGSHIAIPAVIGTESTIATFAIGIREAPTIGAPAFSFRCTPKDYQAPVAGGVVKVSADFSSASVGQPSTAKRWGQLLAVGASVSSTTNNGSLDNGAATSAGAIAVLHLTTSAGAMGTNSWVIKVQHATNDSTWNDLITFAANGTAVTAKWDESVTGSVARYVRAQATKSAGTDIVYWVNFIRL